MGNPLTKLFGQTALYGLSSVLARLLNFLLVPLYTRIFAPDEYAVVIEFYAYAVFLAVLLTYGLETAYFRFSSSKDEQKVFGTANISVLISSLLFFLVILLGLQPIADALLYPNHPEYVLLFAGILALDAISAIPMARLRNQGKALLFASLRFSSIIINIGLNLLWLVFLPKWNLDLPTWLYSPGLGVYYIFLANLISSLFLFLALLPQILSHLQLDKALLNKLLKYSWPLLLAGLAGAINETLDRALLKYLLPKGEAMYELGVYGACYKLAIFMTLFVQAFRLGAEPFFFQQGKGENNLKSIAKATHFFTLAGCFIFLLINFFLDFFKGFVDEEYHGGLEVVPILLAANLFLGLYINLSIWYKLSDKTKYAAMFAFIGASLTLVINLWGIPKYGYMASAWATFVAYLAMFLCSFILGKKKYPIPYQWKKLLGYMLFSILLYFFIPKLPLNSYVAGSIGLLIFGGVAFILERKQFKKPA